MFGSVLLRREGVRGFEFDIGCLGVIQMTRDGRRQVRIGRIWVGMVTVVTTSTFVSRDLTNRIRAYLSTEPDTQRKSDIIINSGAMSHMACN